jgi:hypothetical protein
VQSDPGKRFKITFHKARAVIWLLFGLVSFLLGWQNQVSLVWLASIYANVVSDWGAGEAADDEDVIKRLSQIEQALQKILATLEEKK